MIIHWAENHTGQAFGFPFNSLNYVSGALIVLDPPVFAGTISGITEDEDTGDQVHALGGYFSGATSYSIDPAIESGWSFNASTGSLTIDTSTPGVFGPYIITGINDDGSDDSNSFSVTITPFWADTTDQTTTWTDTTDTSSIWTDTTDESKTWTKQ